MNEISDTELFNGLAEKYKVNKENAFVNILESGKILNNAKEELSHGQFHVWLSDHRVSESVRTAQRLMAIFNNYGHVLDTDKYKDISNIGLTALLELQKLPDRFKKEIEVVIDDKKEMRQVVDEDKLGDFLDTTVQTKDGSCKIKDLSVTEIRKQINNVQGVYEPEEPFEKESNEPEEEPPSNVQLGNGMSSESDIFGTILKKLSELSDYIQDLNDVCDKLDESSIYGYTEEDKSELKLEMKKFKDKVQRTYIVFGEVNSKL